jgi:hypothetical protein
MDDQNTEFVFNGVTVSEEGFMHMLDESQQMMAATQREIAENFNVSDQTAGAIMYLRTRSRWTLAKEQELIERDHTGNPISMNVVLSGDF